MLTISHTRKKRDYELVLNKYLERMKQAVIHPKDLYELMKLLNMHSAKDVEALYDNGFFKITTQFNCKIARELIHILHQATNNYFVYNLPVDLRQPFMRLMEQELKEKNE